MTPTRCPEYALCYEPNFERGFQSPVGLAGTQSTVWPSFDPVGLPLTLSSLRLSFTIETLDHRDPAYNADSVNFAPMFRIRTSENLR